MTDADKTAEKLTASIRKTKAGAASTTSKPATPSKATPKRATSARSKTAAKPAAARATKKAPASGSFQVGRRVWPD
jgi:hypothetical protein